MFPPTPLLAALLGVITQRLLAPIHEPPTVLILKLWFFTDTILFLALSKLSPSPLVTFLTLNTTYFSTLIIASAIYRLYLHPLSAFPGHRAAALSNLHAAYLALTGITHTATRTLHRQHGDFIRTGPNELSINHVDGLKLLLRSPGHEPRGPMHDVGKIMRDKSLVATRDTGEHQRWRKVWDEAFKGSALNEYYARLEAHVQRLLGVIEMTEGNSVNVVPVAANYVFDIIVDVSFGFTYGLQIGSGDPSYMSFVHRFAHIVASLGTLRNLCDLLPYFPSTADAGKFEGMNESLLTRRLTEGNFKSDVVSYFLPHFTPTQLSANTTALVVGGSDTTATILANCFRELALNQDTQERLFQEILTRGAVDVRETKTLPYLRAVVDETLRLWNAIPGGVQAVVPPDGAEVGGVKIPGGTVTRVMHYTLMTDDRYFPNGDAWIPERWTDPELSGVKEPRAFVPFSYGPHTCIGRQLALGELRMAVARVVRVYRVEVGEGYDEEKYRREFKDHATAMIGEIQVRFIPRE